MNMLSTLQRLQATLFARLSPTWQPAGMAALLLPSPTTINTDDDTALWFAVPKQRVTRHKKRLKTTVQKRIKPLKNIITCPRTGEVTLAHRLPFNWKDYLPTDTNKYD